MKILILDYSGEKRLKSLIPAGHTVIMEQSDGMNAYRIAGNWQPDIILVNGEARPSHNRQTIQAIQRRKKTSTIPVYIVTDQQVASEEPGLSIRWIHSKNIGRLFTGKKVSTKRN